MSNLRVPNLVFRTDKALRLTHGELDGNFTKLKDSINAGFDIMGTSLNPDGTIKVGAVSVDALGERVVGAENLAFASALFAVDAGGVNALVVTFDPPMEAYADGTVLYVRVAAENTGVSTLKVDALAATQILKGTSPLEAGDLKRNSVAIFAYYGSNWQLVGMAASTAETDTGPQSIVYDYQQAQPANGAAATFPHNLGVAPESYAVYLVCSDAAGDAGYDYNEQVAIGDVIISGGAPAFSITTSTANVTVTRLTEEMEVPDPATPGSTVGITEAKWQIRVVIRSSVTPTTFMQPPLSIQVVNPHTSICYGSNLFVLVSGGSRWISISLTTGVTKLFATPATAHLNGAAALFLFDSKHQVVTCSSQGLHKFNAADPDGISSFGSNPSGGLSSRAPLEISTDSPATAALPDVYVTNETATISALPLFLLRTSGGAVTQSATLGSISLQNSSIVNVAAFTAMETSASIKVRWVAWNFIKKRLYVVTENSGLVHIFKLSAATLNAWWQTPIYAQLAYEKAIAISGEQSTDAQYLRERMSLEYDLVSGQEKSVSFIRVPNSTGMAVAVRVPWVEG